MPDSKQQLSSSYDWERSGKKELALALLRHGEVQAVFPVHNDGLIIGRDPANEITLQDPRVSKKHAEVTCYQDELIIQDLDSRNGTRVNELRVKTHALTPGDIIRIGRSSFLFMALGVPRERNSRRAMGWLVAVTSHGNPMKLPVTEVPILIGRADYADIRVPSQDIAEFHSQIVATSNRVQLTQLNTDIPRRFFLKDGHQLTFGPIQAEYKIATVTAPQARTGPPGEEDMLASVAPAPAAPADGGLLNALQQEAERVEVDIPMPDSSPGTPAEGGHRASVTACILTALTGPRKGKSFSIMYQPMVIGRAKGCGVRLEDATVAEQHARLHRVSGDVVIECLASKQGIFLDGRRIERRQLRPGDRLRIGTTEFVVHI